MPQAAFEISDIRFEELLQDNERKVTVTTKNSNHGNKEVSVRLDGKIAVFYIKTGEIIKYFEVPQLEERIWRSKAYDQFSKSWKALVGKNGYNVYRARRYMTKKLELTTELRMDGLRQWDIETCKRVIQLYS